MLRIFLSLLIIGIAFPVSVFGQLRFEYDFSEVAVGGDPAWITEANGNIYFSAENSYQGRELWVYDLDLGQSYLLMDFNSGFGSGDPREFITTDEGLWGIANTEDRMVIWNVSSEGNTVNLAVGPEADFNHIVGLMQYGDYICFLGQSVTAPGAQLYIYDKSTGEHRLLSSPPQPFQYIVSTQLGLLAENEEIYFSAIDTNDYIVKLYRYSFLNEDISLVNNQLTAAGNSIHIEEMVGIGDTLAFRCRCGNNINCLGFYVRGIDSIYIDTDIELPRLYTLDEQTIIAAGNRLYLRQWNRNFSRGTLKTYDFANKTATLVPGIPTSRSTFSLQQLNDGSLLACTNTSVFGREFAINKIDPYTGEIESVSPLIELWEGLPEVPATLRGLERKVALLGENWFVTGPGREGEKELFRLNLTNDSPGEQLTELNPGNQSGIARLPIQTTADGGIYLRQRLYDNQRRGFRPIIHYESTLQLAESILPDSSWSFHSKLYRFPGYLVLTQIKYEGQFYEAIGYDSLAQTWIPILTAENTGCNTNIRAGGSVVQFGDYLYLTKCDEAGRLQLHRHSIGEAGAVQVSAFTDKSLFKGSLFDEPLVSTGTRLIMSYADSNGDIFAKGWLSYDGETFDTIPLPTGYVPRDPGLASINQAAYFNVAAANDIIGDYSTMILDETEWELKPISVNGEMVQQFSVGEFKQVGNFVYFSYGDSLYQYNGVTDEVVSLLKWPDNFNYAFNYIPTEDRLYFIGARFGEERRLYEWVYGQDAPESITGRNENYNIRDIGYAVLINGVIFFTGNDGLRGLELWSYRPNCFDLSLSAEPSNINWPTGSVSVVPDSSAVGPLTYQWSTGDTGATLEQVSAGFYEVTVTDANDCSTSGSIWIETNGVISNARDQSRKAAKMIVYPNPVQDQLYISIDDSESIGSILLYTLDGRKILEKRFSLGDELVEKSINTSSLRSGIYIIQVLNSEGELLGIRRVKKG